MFASAIDDFLSLVGTKILAELADLAPEASADVRHWVVVADDFGVDLAETASDGPAAHELLASHIEHGARAAAYVTYVPTDPERVLAQVLVADPRDSDVRQASVVREAEGGVALGPWDYTV